MRNDQLGMISVPWQEYTTLYTPVEALRFGTVFPCLNQPYTPIPCPQQAMNMQPTIQCKGCRTCKKALSDK